MEKVLTLCSYETVNVTRKYLGICQLNIKKRLLKMFYVIPAETHAELYFFALISSYGNLRQG